MNRREKALRPMYLAGACPVCGARPGEACQNTIRGGAYHTYLHVSRTCIIDTAYQTGFDEGYAAAKGKR